MKLFSLILVIFMGCSSNKNVTENSLSKKAIEKVSFEQLVQSSVGGYEHPQIKVIKEQKALNETFGYVNRYRKPGFPVPNKIDFSKETVVAVFVGQKNTGGFSIEIDKVIDEGEQVKVLIKELSPGKNDMVTMAITQPFCIVKINTSKELVFEKVN